jgi:hypothetical protein
MRRDHLFTGKLKTFCFLFLYYCFKSYFCPKFCFVEYDEFGFEESWSDESPVIQPHEAPAEPHVPMREHFPEAGSNYMGGESDGYEYRSTFAGSNLAYTYDMIQEFLREEGYGDVPIPKTADELRLFKRSRHAQLRFFEERGYVHNPIKILFPNPSRQRFSLTLVIFNEQAPQHLLRFHGVLPPNKILPTEGQNAI